MAAAIDAPATLQVGRQPVGTIQRAVRKGCFAPSFVVTSATASKFGSVAEAIIEVDYIATMGGAPFREVFLDNPVGPLSYVAFLAAHHPSLNVALLAAQIGLSGGVLVPDILDTRGLQEFYEIKPDSIDGRPAGRAKLAAIDAFMSFNSLPYRRGVSFTPTPPLAGPALGAIIGPIPVLTCGLPIVTLDTVLSGPGLLLYELCVEADLDCYRKVLALEALIAAIIVAILILRGIPIIPVPLRPVPAPVLAATGEGDREVNGRDGGNVSGSSTPGK